MLNINVNMKKKVVLFILARIVCYFLPVNAKSMKICLMLYFREGFTSPNRGIRDDSDDGKSQITANIRIFILIEMNEPGCFYQSVFIS